jgi:hypothetical protein
VDDRGWRATIVGETRLPAPQAGSYRLRSVGQWTSPTGRRFETEGISELLSPDGLVARSARGGAMRTICP